MKTSFINEFLKESRTIGAIAPSSIFLGHKMLKKINFDIDYNIIELGPGKGAITKVILKKMSINSKLISIELNQLFVNELREKINDNRFDLICGSATDIFNIKNQFYKSNVDLVISSLPLAMIPIKMKIKIINGIKETLADNGKFIQYQYSLNSKDLLDKKFSNVEVSFTPLNLPPAFVYHCQP